MKFKDVYKTIAVASFLSLPYICHPDPDRGGGCTSYGAETFREESKAIETRAEKVPVIETSETLEVFVEKE